LNNRAILLQPAVQIAYIVNDIEEAAARFARLFGWGPFFTVHHLQMQRVLHRGREVHVDFSNGFGNAGNVMIELIQRHDVGPSVFHELHRPGEEGLHHIAVFIDDLDRCLEAFGKSGLEVAGYFEAFGTRAAMLDTCSIQGHFVEIYERSPFLNVLYKMVADAAIGFDGSHPVRALDTAAFLAEVSAQS
jgi:Glyoxalase/Bleomycin resistance protein/Dioxygenase superfamily